MTAVDLILDSKSEMFVKLTVLLKIQTILGSMSTVKSFFDEYADQPIFIY